MPVQTTFERCCHVYNTNTKFRRLHTYKSPTRLLLYFLTRAMCAFLSSRFNYFYLLKSWSRGSITNTSTALNFLNSILCWGVFLEMFLFPRLRNFKFKFWSWCQIQIQWFQAALRCCCFTIVYFVPVNVIQGRTAASNISISLKNVVLRLILDNIVIYLAFASSCIVEIIIIFSFFL